MSYRKLNTEMSSFLVRGKHGFLLLLITNLQFHGKLNNYYLQFSHQSETSHSGCTHKYAYNLLTKHTGAPRDYASCPSVHSTIPS